MWDHVRICDSSMSSACFTMIKWKSGPHVADWDLTPWSSQFAECFSKLGRWKACWLGHKLTSHGLWGILQRGCITGGLACDVLHLFMHVAACSYTWDLGLVWSAVPIPRKTFDEPCSHQQICVIIQALKPCRLLTHRMKRMKWCFKPQELDETRHQSSQASRPKQRMYISREVVSGSVTIFYFKHGHFKVFSQRLFRSSTGAWGKGHIVQPKSLQSCKNTQMWSI